MWCSPPFFLLFFSFFPSFFSPPVFHFFPSFLIFHFYFSFFIFDFVFLSLLSSLIFFIFTGKVRTVAKDIYFASYIAVYHKENTIFVLQLYKNTVLKISPTGIIFYFLRVPLQPPSPSPLPLSPPGSLRLFIIIYLKKLHSPPLPSPHHLPHLILITSYLLSDLILNALPYIITLIF